MTEKRSGPYLNDWAEKGWQDKIGEDAMLADFQIDKSALEGCEVLVASYTYENYSGSAYVLYRKGRQLFEVEGGHCSCYGLEGQWEPSKTNKTLLKHRLTKGYFPDNAGPAVKAALGL